MGFSLFQVLYINGVEVYRSNLPNGAINATTYAIYEGSWSFNTKIMAGGWLVNGTNLIALELHKSATSSNLLFDMQMDGSREAVNCLPDPSTIAIP